MFYAHLDNFQPNPWQPRQTLDETALRELAHNLLALKAIRPETRGLLQLPAARLVSLDGDPLDPDLVYHTWYPDDNATGRRNVTGDDLTAWLQATGYGGLQIAWGHRRLEAFRLLAQTDPTYELIPFELAHFSNEEMFQIALSENVARADLNPIEIAESMLCDRDEFGKSSKEIGTLFGLSDSAVRNLLRLLDLPAEPRKALAEGRMSQSTARQLLTLYAIPEAARQNLGNFSYRGEWGLDENSIIEAAMHNAQATDIEDMITHLITYNARKLANVRWQLTDHFDDAELAAPDCETCPYHLVRQKAHYCAKSSCFTAKVRAWQRQQLIPASLASGIPLSDSTLLNKMAFDYSPRKEALPYAQAAQCPNLCLQFSDYKYQRKNADYEFCTVPGFPGAEIVCAKREQNCTCYQAHKAGLTTPSDASSPQATPSPSPQPANENLTPSSERTITEADLKALNREIREQKRQAKAGVAAIREEAAKSLFNALSLHHLPAWKNLLSYLYGFSAGTELTIEDLFYNVSTYLVARHFQYETNAETDTALTLRVLNRWFKDDLNLDPLQPVSTETPKSWMAEDDPEDFTPSPNS